MTDCQIAQPKPKLIINLDINKTLIFGDMAKGQSLQSGVLALCADSCWGKVTQEGKWELKHDSFSFNSPDKDLITYGDYLREKHPKKKAHEILDKDERTKYNNNIKSYIGKITDTFIEPNNPGHSLMESFKLIMNHLTIPPAITNYITSDNGECHNLFKKIYEHGHYHLLLSLFFLMIKLTQQGRDFALVFRSFGDDIHNVMTEFNEFCKGNHPIFNGKPGAFPQVRFDGSEGSANFLLSNEHIGIIYRGSERLDDMAVAIGTLKRHNKALIKDLPKLYQNDEGVSLIKGGIELYHYLKKGMNAGIRSYAFGDQYSIWFENEERSLFSKPTLIDPYDMSIHQIFFDDNIIESDTFSIVDCRNVITGEQIPIKDSLNKYIIQVDTLSAALDNDYFVKNITKAEELRKKDYELCKENCGKKADEEEKKKKAALALVNDAFEAFNYEKDYKDIGEFVGKYIIAYKEKINQS